MARNKTLEEDLQGFTSLWERFARICEIFGRGFSRICKTLGEDLQGFVKDLWERICETRICEDFGRDMRICETLGEDL